MVATAGSDLESVLAGRGAGTADMSRGLWAKALGYALMNAMPEKKIIVLDSIKVDTGDYIDIGLPAAAGRVIPVVVKTLVFGK